jgi:hypothetical protein
MRRFLITSPKFTGTAEIVYNSKDVLCMIDITQANMDVDTIHHFKRATPAVLSNLLTPGLSFSAETTIIEADFEVSFELFWKEYPYHRNRFKVEKGWSQLGKSDQVKAFHSLKSYKRYLGRNAWQTPMIADRYLRDREFETEWNKL